MSHLPSVTQPTFEAALRHHLPPTESSFETIARAYLAEDDNNKPLFLKQLMKLTMPVEILVKKIFTIDGTHHKIVTRERNFKKLAETLLLFQAYLSDESNSKRMKRTWLHYVINTDGAIKISETSTKHNHSDSDKLVFNWAKEYAAIFSIDLEDTGEKTIMTIDDKDITCARWGKLRGLSPEYSLREVGKAINSCRYGFKDVIPSNLFRLNANKSDHYKVNAILLADLSNLAYRSQKYVKKEVKRLHFKFVQWLEDLGTDTQGYVIEDDNAIVIAFRGTTPTELKDIKTDIHILPTDFTFQGQPSGKIHSGFHNATKSIWSQLLSALMRIEVGERTVFITGHSLGGALAKIAAIRLVDEKITTPIVYTFGAPRVGDFTFTERYNDVLGERTHLHINNMDVVPHVPFTGMGYEHVGFIIREFTNNHKYNELASHEWGRENMMRERFNWMDEKADIKAKLNEQFKSSMNNSVRYLAIESLLAEEDTLEQIGDYETVDEFEKGLIDDHAITEYMFKLACSHVDDMFKLL